MLYEITVLREERRIYDSEKDEVISSILVADDDAKEMLVQVTRLQPPLTSDAPYLCESLSFVAESSIYKKSEEAKEWQETRISGRDSCVAACERAVEQQQGEVE